jgi:methylated-DNA-[protein]-cysteine S-methyltransferase
VGFAKDSANGDELQLALEEFCEGNESPLLEIDLDFDGLTELTIRVLRCCRKIPLGEVRTYGELAATAGCPAAARFVGQVMARNRFPIAIPCHRVIGASGSLTGYSGYQGLETKRKLLELERGKSVRSVMAVS